MPWTNKIQKQLLESQNDMNRQEMYATYILNQSPADLDTLRSWNRTSEYMLSK